MTVNNMNMFFNNPTSGNNGGGSVPLGGEVQLVSSNRQIVNISGAIYAQWGLPVSDESLFDANFWEFGMVRYPFTQLTNLFNPGTIKIARKPNSNHIVVTSGMHSVNNTAGTLVTLDGGLNWTTYRGNFRISSNKRNGALLWSDKWNKFVSIVDGFSHEQTYNVFISDDGVVWQEIDDRFFTSTNGRVLDAYIDNTGDLVIVSAHTSSSGVLFRRYANPTSSSQLYAMNVGGVTNLRSAHYVSGRHVVTFGNTGTTSILTSYSIDVLSNGGMVAGQVLNTTQVGFPGGSIMFTTPITGGVSFNLLIRGVRTQGGDVVYYYSNDGMQTLTPLTVDTSKFGTYLGFYDGLYYSTGSDGIVYTSPDLTTFTPTTLSSEIGVPILLTDKRVIGAGGFGGKLAGSSTTISSADGFSRYVRIK